METSAEVEPMLNCYTDVTGQRRNLIPVIECLECYSYRIPSFSVITVQMRRIKFEVEMSNQNKKILDGFIRDYPSLQRVYPAEISIEDSFDAAGLVEVSS